MKKNYIYIYIYIYIYTHTHIYIYIHDSIPGQVIAKTKKMVLNASLLNTQHYKVQIKSKWSN